MSTGSLEFTEQVLNAGGGACSHADAAESVYGAGGGGVRRREGRGFLSQLASKVEEETTAICHTGGWRGRGLWSPYPRYHCGC